MDRPNLAFSDAGPGGMLDQITQAALREKCCELALYLLAGVDAPLLVEEVEELARGSWALRVDDDN